MASTFGIVEVMDARDIVNECRERRRDWLNRAVFLIRPIMQKRTGLIVPSVKIRIATAMEGRIGGIAIPSCDYHNKPLILIHDEDYSAKPWIALGIVIHECIHVSGIWNHLAGFGKAARQMELSGTPSKAGFDKSCRWYDLPVYVRGILSRMDMYPPAIRDLRTAWIDEHARNS